MDVATLRIARNTALAAHIQARHKSGAIGSVTGYPFTVMKYNIGGDSLSTTNPATDVLAGDYSVVVWNLPRTRLQTGGSAGIISQARKEIGDIGSWFRYDTYNYPDYFFDAQQWPLPLPIAYRNTAEARAAAAKSPAYTGPVSQNVVFYADTIRTVTGTAVPNSRDQVGADMVVVAPIMTLAATRGTLSLVTGNVPTLDFSTDLFQADRFSREGDSITSSGFNPITTYGLAKDKITASSITKKGQLAADFAGGASAAVQSVTSAVQPLAMFVYDCVAKPSEDTSSSSTFDAKGELVSFVSGPTRHSRTSDVLRE